MDVAREMMSGADDQAFPYTTHRRLARIIIICNDTTGTWQYIWNGYELSHYTKQNILFASFSHPHVSIFNYYRSRDDLSVYTDRQADHMVKPTTLKLQKKLPPFLSTLKPTAQVSHFKYRKHIYRYMIGNRSTWKRHHTTNRRI